NQRLFAMNQMATIELGADRDGQSQPAHGRLDHIPVRHIRDKIAAEANETLGAPIYHCPDSFDNVVSLGARWLESEHSLQSIEKRGLRFLVDTDRAGALHVRMPL